LGRFFLSYNSVYNISQDEVKRKKLLSATPLHSEIGS